MDISKLYDINKILEKAKNDNSKLNNTTIRETIVNKNILSTLESREISLTEIKEASLKYDQIKEEEVKEEFFEPEEQAEITRDEVADDLTMTREFKYKELSEKVEKFNSNPLIEQVMPDNDLSFTFQYWGKFIANGFPDNVPAWYTGPHGDTICMISFLPPYAPTGSPPPIIFPKQAISGVML